MKVNLLVLLPVITFFYCNNSTQKTTTLSIANKTRTDIDSVIIDTYGLTYVSVIIPSGKTVSKSVNIDYSDNYEGAFRMKIFVKDSLENTALFGYYSNAGGINKKYAVDILEGFLIKQLN